MRLLATWFAATAWRSCTAVDWSCTQLGETYNSFPVSERVYVACGCRKLLGHCWLIPCLLWVRHQFSVLVWQHVLG
jgi:hypothetical protein